MEIRVGLSTLDLKINRLMTIVLKEISRYTHALIQILRFK